jgi:hypothetical protein
MLVILLVVTLVSMSITITSYLYYTRMVWYDKIRNYRMPKKGLEPLLYRYEWYVLTD